MTRTSRMDTYANVYVHDHRVCCAAGMDDQAWRLCRAAPAFCAKHEQHWLAATDNTLPELVSATTPRLQLPPLPPALCQP